MGSGLLKGPGPHPPPITVFGRFLLLHPSVSEEDIRGQERNFNLVAEDRSQSSGGPHAPRSPQLDTQQLPPGTAEAERRRSPRPASRAGHWRVRKTRGVVGLNGSHPGWGAGAVEGSRGGRAARLDPWVTDGCVGKRAEPREPWFTWPAGGGGGRRAGLQRCP